MTSETNPENGTTQYFYDSAPSSPGVARPGTTDGDLLKKYDANGNTTCYTYDGLHRVLSTTYSGPNSTGVNKYFVYDSAVVNSQQMANAQGRLAEAYTATTPTGTKATDLGFSYSPRGEETDVYESTPHSAGYYHVIRSYWANRNVNTLSGLGLPTITYGANGQGQTSTVNASTGTNPVSSTSYNASGQVTGVTFGSLDTAAFSFDNNTGRMTQYKETINGSATFGTIGWNANGTPSSLAITDPFNASNGGKTCTFGYDDLIRVSGTSCTGSIWSQTFTYDPFGNITKSGSGSWLPGYNSATNRYTLGGTSYDANGNLLTDTFHTYTWNGDGQVLSVDSTGLTYDALGRQVERTNGAGYVQYVYAGSTKLALMNGQTLTRAFIPLPGGTQGVYTTSFSKYRVPDWLGSFRIESTSTRTWGFSGAFAPFGERYAEGGSAAAKTFAGHNWDTVSDLYDAQFREDHGGQGRWTSPDPAGLDAAQLTDPQTWNLYAYVRNSPLNLVDPFGLGGCGSNYDTCVDVSAPAPADPPMMSSGTFFGTGTDGLRLRLLWWKTFLKEVITPPHAGKGSCLGVFIDTAAGPVKTIQKAAKDVVPVILSAMQAAPSGANVFARVMSVTGAFSDTPPAETAEGIAQLQAFATTLAVAAPFAKTASANLLVAAFDTVAAVSLFKELKAGANGECTW
jgi:RHS repeat-associated protein